MDPYEHLDRAWSELTPEEKKQIMDIKHPISGVGHQYKREEKAINACKTSLQRAYIDLGFIDNLDINLLKFDIQKLINRCLELQYGANEAFKQNQS